METTFSIIKPDATRRNLEGKILAILQDNNFEIIAMKKMRFSKEQAAQFYQVHSQRPFFNSLCEIMSSSPIICSILRKSNAVNDYRELMGATNPSDAKIGTIRNLYGISIDENTVHGSDSLENAKIESEFIFHSAEIFAE